ncbi:hypothetical protein BDY19DRAFT_971911 [Irpex rosettiformis]|uniref:Uncharacterized protein n=1 Tax=Irpex rosettiformis TaxID=378272 RepID=A0ACB8TQY4_9APHY|nr:hypothetical protein BDY19DRAFT_971911 [Irpex rosettiformis]
MMKPQNPPTDIYKGHCLYDHRQAGSHFEVESCFPLYQYGLNIFVSKEIMSTFILYSLYIFIL